MVARPIGAIGLACVECADGAEPRTSSGLDVDRGHCRGKPVHRRRGCAAALVLGPIAISWRIDHAGQMLAESGSTATHRAIDLWRDGANDAEREITDAATMRTRPPSQAGR